MTNAALSDELELLCGLHGSHLTLLPSPPSLTLRLVHRTLRGVCGEVKITLADSLSYPAGCRPVVSLVRSGLDSDDETKLLRNLNEGVTGEFRGELCLVALCSNFVGFLDELPVVCGVCLDEIDRAFVTQTCWHAFHDECLKDWAERWRSAKETTAEAEFARARRRQIESSARSELKSAASRLSFSESDAERLVKRRDGLMNKINELAVVAPPATTRAAAAQVDKTPEREKSDEDIADPAEAQKRLAEVLKRIKDTTFELKAASKEVMDLENQLSSVKRSLEMEASKEARLKAKMIPCPVCRTEFEI